MLGTASASRPAIGWALLLLVIDVQAWWAMFGYRNRHTWTFLQFAILLLETIFLYLLAALALPMAFLAEVVDLRANYFRHARWFFGSFIAVLLVSLLKDVVFAGSLPGGFNLGFHLFWIVGASIAAITRSDLFHKALSGSAPYPLSFISPRSSSSCIKDEQSGHHRG